ncbi:MAG: ABC transporter permease [Burkholderiales bacterium]|nr:ABC transporter permease [Burkholderiales bacterium]
MNREKPAAPVAASRGPWGLAWRRLLRDRVGIAAAVVVAAFLALTAASAAGWVAGDWSRETGVSYAPPAFLGPGGDGPPDGRLPRAEGASAAGADATGIADPLAQALAEIARIEATGVDASHARAATLPFGADKWGRDVLAKTVKGTGTSLLVGFVAAARAVLLGAFFGAQAGYLGGRTDAFFNWLYSVFTAIPYLLLVLAVAAVLDRKGTLTVILILGLTGWTGTFRLVRADYLRHRGREYVLAAEVSGASHARRMYVHILPNVGHVLLVQLSLHVVLFIKAEVILSFLGFGVGVDTVSWGSMLNEAQSELLLGKWWQLAAATVAMAALVTAFSLFTDALRDALDPRLP